MLTRREAIKQTAATAACLLVSPHPACEAAEPAGTLVNDLHSHLNATRVHAVQRPSSVDQIRDAVLTAERASRSLTVAGGRHAMGGQQFGTAAELLDLTGFNRVVGLDAGRGVVEVESGIQWPKLIEHLHRIQDHQPGCWTIHQKQTGADRLSLGGALAANIHGRGLRTKPIIADVESFDLLDAGGSVRTCSRTENADLFSLAIGGYGLFGIITNVRLRLVRRRKLERLVSVIDIAELPTLLDERLKEGCVAGDFQYATDPASDDFLRRGVFSSYRPVDDATPMPANQSRLTEDDWRRLLRLAHTDRARAFAEYSRHYRSTDRQVYWSDTHQLSLYLDDYHASLDRELGAPCRGSEMITEIYVPRSALPAFLDDARRDFRANGVNLIYGTIRWIERDDESYLAWARKPYACIIFNLHVDHTPAGIEKAAADFRRLIDRAVDHGGSYYLTYHRWATRPQVEACHPRLVEALRLKRRHDPDERFQSEWYRHYRAMFADRLG